MQLTDTVTLKAPRDRVIGALTDPAVLQACIPGCTAVTRLNGHRYNVSISIPTGLRPLKFAGVVRLDMTDAPAAVSILRGGNGRADLRLTEEGDTTVLSYTAQAELSGKAAMLGQTMIGGIVRRLLAGFFERLQAQLA